MDLEIIGARYQRVDAIVAETVQHRPSPKKTWTDRVDGVLTHSVFGVIDLSRGDAGALPGALQLVGAGDRPGAGHRRLAAERRRGRPCPRARSPTCCPTASIAGVGNVLAFVPQIGLLFLFIGVMEDVGYLARVAFVIDRVMGRVGLHGKSFVPMLSGFSCAVPAVMATRTLESRTDRMLTMAVLPLMSCSARLPVYVLVIATVFRPGMRVFGLASAGAVTLLAMYLLSVTAALARRRCCAARCCEARARR